MAEELNDTYKAHTLLQVLLNLKEGKLVEEIRYEEDVNLALEDFITQTVIPGYTYDATVKMNPAIDWLYGLILDDEGVTTQIEKSQNWIDTTNGYYSLQKCQFKALTAKVRSIALNELKKLI